MLECQEILIITKNPHYTVRIDIQQQLNTLILKMHSYIVFSANKQSREKTIAKMINAVSQKNILADQLLNNVKDPDINIVKPENSIGISDIRNLKRAFSLKSYSGSYKFAVILSADLLTIEAQQAILKILEEPSEKTLIFLELDNPYSLLGTILSRCQLIKAPGMPKTTKISSQQISLVVSKLQKLSPGKKLSLLTEFSKNSDPKGLFLAILLHLRHEVKDDPTLLPAVKLTNQSISALDSNINPKLVVEHFALNFMS